MTEGSRLQKQHPVDAETSVSDGDGVAEYSQRGYARLAGLMYLLVLAFDIAGMVVVSAVRGSGSFLDAAHTIVAREPLYRIGLLLGLAGSLCTIPLAVGLYVALRPVDGNLALMGLLFRMVEAATGAMGTASAFATLQIYLAANHPSGLEANQLGTPVDFSSSGLASYVAAIFFCVGSRGCSRVAVDSLLVMKVSHSIITSCCRLMERRLPSCPASTRFRYSRSSCRIVRPRCSVPSRSG
jgi:hypothetical protein